VSGAAAAALLGGPGPLAITTASLPTPVYNTAYSQTVATTGGTAPITFAVTAGSLPAGLTLHSSTGVIDGTPTAPGAYSFTVTATDALSTTASQAYSGTIVDPAMSITTTSLPNATCGSAYSQTLAATGGAGVYTWSVISGSLPAGLTLHASTGVIDGTPTVQGTASFTVQVADAFTQSATKALSLTAVFTPVSRTYTSGSGTEVPPVGWAQVVITADGSGGPHGATSGVHVGGPGGGGARVIDTETAAGQNFTYAVGTTTSSTTVTDGASLNIIAGTGASGAPGTSSADGGPGNGGVATGGNDSNINGQAGSGSVGGTAGSGATSGNSPGGGAPRLGTPGAGNLEFDYT